MDSIRRPIMILDSLRDCLTVCFLFQVNKTKWILQLDPGKVNGKYTNNHPALVLFKFNVGLCCYEISIGYQSYCHSLAV